LAQNYEKIMAGPCRVTFDVGGTSPLVIETTIGGVELNLEFATRDVKTDQTGDTPVKKIKKATSCKAVVPIGEYDHKTLAKMIPTSTLITNTTSGKSKVVVNGNAGQDLLQYAKPVLIEPLDVGIDYSITILKGLPNPQIKFKFDTDTDRVIGVEIEAFPDPTSNNDMVVFGDKTVTAA
jgi:hypothetical protein